MNLKMWICEIIFWDKALARNPVNHKLFFNKSTVIQSREIIVEKIWTIDGVSFNNKLLRYLKMEGVGFVFDWPHFHRQLPSVPEKDSHSVFRSKAAKTPEVVPKPRLLTQTLGLKVTFSSYSRHHAHRILEHTGTFAVSCNFSTSRM